MEKLNLVEKKKFESKSKHPYDSEGLISVGNKLIIFSKTEKFDNRIIRNSKKPGHMKLKLFIPIM